MYVSILNDAMYIMYIEYYIHLYDTHDVLYVCKCKYNGDFNEPINQHLNLKLFEYQPKYSFYCSQI